MLQAFKVWFIFILYILTGIAIFWAIVILSAVAIGGG